MTTSQKRSHPRIDLRVSVQVEQESRLQKFFSRNLSSGGVFLEVADEPPAIGTHLKLAFDIPGIQRSFRAEAEVVHHHRFETYDDKMKKQTRTGIGLKFLNLTAADQTLIQKYIAGKDVRVRS
jgi:uncharacterized protein (TIGR02266 family)